MNVRRTAGAFLAVLGGLMIAAWVGLFATDQVPEVHTAAVSLAFLLAAEMTAAVLSVVSGAALVAERPWAYRAYLIASGMMLYSITNYLGVLAEDGQLPLVALFGFFLAGILMLLAWTVSDAQNSTAKGSPSVPSSRDMSLGRLGSAGVKVDGDAGI